MQNGESIARIKDLENEVSSLKISNATLAVSVEHLAVAVKALTETVQTLRSTMDQGRGALWVMVGAAGALGAIVSTFAKKMLGL